MVGEMERAAGIVFWVISKDGLLASGESMCAETEWSSLEVATS